MPRNLRSAVVMLFTHSLILSFLFITNLAFAQCSDVFQTNRKEKHTHSLATKPEFLVVRSDFDYSIQFENTEDNGVIAVISTTGHNPTLIKPLEKDDKLMFITATGEKTPFDFILDGEKTIIQGRSAYINTLQMDMKSIKWLSENDISQIRFVNMVEMKMFPYSLEPVRQAKLKQVAKCFLAELDPTKVKDKKVTPNLGVVVNPNDKSSNVAIDNNSEVLAPVLSKEELEYEIRRCEIVIQCFERQIAKNNASLETETNEILLKEMKKYEAEIENYLVQLKNK